MDLPSANFVCVQTSTQRSAGPLGTSPFDFVVTVKLAASAMVCPLYMKDSKLSVAPDSSSSAP